MTSRPLTRFLLPLVFLALILGVASHQAEQSVESADDPEFLWVWGQNNYGQLGDGSVLELRKPVKGPALKPIQLSSGEVHSLALLSDGTVWAWGYNGDGELGIGTTTDSAFPVQVQGLPSIVEVSGGGAHSVALSADGSVWTWGWNAQGQLGDGTTTSRLSAIQVQIDEVVAVSAASSHTMALKKDGTVWAWGSNNSGELGDGTNLNRTRPVRVRDIADAVAIAAGRNHSVVLRADGTVWTLGEDNSGQLGNGPPKTSGSSSPVQALNLEEIVQISSGTHSVLALKKDGTVWAWGIYYGLGSGLTQDGDAPAQVPSLSNVTQVIAAGEFNIALNANGEVWTWGFNGTEGRLGNDSTAISMLPVKPLGLPPIALIGGGSSSHHALALAATDEDWGPGESTGPGPASEGNLVELVPVLQRGGYVAAGTGFQESAEPTIAVSGIPSGSTVTHAYLYWGFNARSDSPFLKSLTFDGSVVYGHPLGKRASTCRGDSLSFAYRADVTPLVSGNSSYAISDIASGDGVLREGASLVVLFENPGLPLTDVVVYDGFNLVGEGGGSILNLLEGFGPTGAFVNAKTTFIVGDGQGEAGEKLRFIGNLGELALDDSLDGSDGEFWDTDTYNVSSVVGPAWTKAQALLEAPSGDADCLMWIAQVMSVQAALANEITLTPSSASSYLGSDQCFTATTYWDGKLVPDSFVSFFVTPVPGRLPATGTLVSNSAGQASFCYTSTQAGFDTLTVYSDPNNRRRYRIEKGDEPLTSTTKWMLPPTCTAMSFDRTLVGTPGNDTLTGTGLRELIFGFAGNDTINGGAGNDCIIGGLGNDSVNGGSGNDRLIGDAGNDVLKGDSGTDVAGGGANADRCDAESESSCES